MCGIRRYVRVLTTAWLVAQTVSLCAFIPRDCCGDHGGAATHAVPAAGDESTDCPLHDAPVQEPECTMRAACDGPVAALPLVWTQPGLLPTSSAHSIDARGVSVPSLPAYAPAAAYILLDTPPPRG